MECANLFEHFSSCLLVLCQFTNFFSYHFYSLLLLLLVTYCIYHFTLTLQPELSIYVNTSFSAPFAVLYVVLSTSRPTPAHYLKIRCGFSHLFMTTPSYLCFHLYHRLQQGLTSTRRWADYKKKLSVIRWAVYHA